MGDDAELAQPEHVGAARALGVDLLAQLPHRRRRSASSPSRPRVEVVAASRIARSVRLETPSISFSVMLPVKPSITTTSATPSVTCVPSMLPMKFSPVPRVAGELLVHGDELGRSLARLLAVGQQRHPRGASMPITAWAKAEPMWANWTRCSGRQRHVGADVEQQDRRARPAWAAAAPARDGRCRGRGAG